MDKRGPKKQETYSCFCCQPSKKFRTSKQKCNHKFKQKEFQKSKRQLNQCATFEISKQIDKAHVVVSNFKITGGTISCPQQPVEQDQLVSKECSVVQEQQLTQEQQLIQQFFENIAPSRQVLPIAESNIRESLMVKAHKSERDILAQPPVIKQGNHQQKQTQHYQSYNLDRNLIDKLPTNLTRSVKTKQIEKPVATKVYQFSKKKRRPACDTTQHRKAITEFSFSSVQCRKCKKQFDNNTYYNKHVCNLKNLSLEQWLIRHSFEEIKEGSYNNIKLNYPQRYLCVHDGVDASVRTMINNSYLISWEIINLNRNKELYIHHLYGASNILLEETIQFLGELVSFYGQKGNCIIKQGRNAKESSLVDIDILRCVLKVLRQQEKDIIHNYLSQEDKPNPTLLTKRKKPPTPTSTLEPLFNKAVKLRGSDNSQFQHYYNTLPFGSNIFINSRLNGCRFGVSEGIVKNLKEEIKQLKVEIQEIKSQRVNLNQKLVSKYSQINSDDDDDMPCFAFDCKLQSNDINDREYSGQNQNWVARQPYLPNVQQYQLDNGNIDAQMFKSKIISKIDNSNKLGFIHLNKCIDDDDERELLNTHLVKPINKQVCGYLSRELDFITTETFFQNTGADGMKSLEKKILPYDFCKNQGLGFIKEQEENTCLFLNDCQKVNKKFELYQYRPGFLNFPKNLYADRHKGHSNSADQYNFISAIDYQQRKTLHKCRTHQKVFTSIEGCKMHLNLYPDCSTHKIKGQERDEFIQTGKQLITNYSTKENDAKSIKMLKMFCHSLRNELVCMRDIFQPLDNMHEGAGPFILKNQISQLFCDGLCINHAVFATRAELKQFFNQKGVPVLLSQQSWTNKYDKKLKQQNKRSQKIFLRLRDEHALIDDKFLLNLADAMENLREIAKNNFVQAGILPQVAQQNSQMIFLTKVDDTMDMEGCLNATSTKQSMSKLGAILGLKACKNYKSTSSCFQFEARSKKINKPKIRNKIYCKDMHLLSSVSTNKKISIGIKPILKGKVLRRKLAATKRQCLTRSETSNSFQSVQEEQQFLRDPARLTFMLEQHQTIISAMNDRSVLLELNCKITRQELWDMFFKRINTTHIVTAGSWAAILYAYKQELSKFVGLLGRTKYKPSTLVAKFGIGENYKTYELTSDGPYIEKEGSKTINLRQLPIVSLGQTFDVDFLEEIGVDASVCGFQKLVTQEQAKLQQYGVHHVCPQGTDSLKSRKVLAEVIVKKYKSHKAKVTLFKDLSVYNNINLITFANGKLVFFDEEASIKFQLKFQKSTFDAMVILSRSLPIQFIDHKLIFVEGIKKKLLSDLLEDAQESCSNLQHVCHVINIEKEQNHAIEQLRKQQSRKKIKKFMDAVMDDDCKIDDIKLVQCDNYLNEFDGMHQQFIDGNLIQKPKRRLVDCDLCGKSGILSFNLEKHKGGRQCKTSPV